MVINEIVLFDDGMCQWKGTAREREWELYCGDAVSALRHMQSESVHCIVTSPPYYSLRDYGVDGQIGLEDAVEDYVNSICDVARELHRVLRNDGLLFMNLGDTYYSGKGASHGNDAKSSKRRFGLRPVDKSGGLGASVERKSAIGVPWRVAIQMMSQRWVLRSSIIWHRDKVLPEAVRDRPHRSYEYVFMFAKDRRYYFDRQPLLDKKIDEDVWNIKARPTGTEIQTAPYPDELVSRCLSIGCPENGVVLDPFAGSGTTMSVALKSGHPAIGIDINREFCNYILEHLE